MLSFCYSLVFAIADMSFPHYLFPLQATSGEQSPDLRMFCKIPKEEVSLLCLFSHAVKKSQGQIQYEPT